ncbi:MAG TPA: hypothetical protein VIJ39_12340 [Solirubrobacteraceae bacterium]
MDDYLHTRSSAQVVASILVAVGVGLFAAGGWLVSYARPLHPPTEHAIHAIGFGLVAGLLLGSLHARRSARVKEGKDDLIDDLDAQVDVMRVAQRAFSAFEDGFLFRRFFIGQARALAQEMEAAAGRQSLDVTPRGHTTRPLLASLTGIDSDICKFVHHLDNNEFFFSSRHSIDFFVRIYEAVEAEEIRQVQRVFVYQDFTTAWSDLGTQRLLAFHENVARFEWRMISTADFRALGEDEDIYDAHLDLDLYGGRYAYLSSQRPHNGSQASGTFVAANAEVKRYEDFFELVWHRASAETPSALGTCTSIDALFTDERRRVHETASPVSSARC